METGRGAHIVACVIMIRGTIEAPLTLRRPSSNILFLFGIIVSDFEDCTLLFGADSVTFLARTQ